MLRALRQPRWILATVVVIALAAVFVRLGFWQLDRLDQRQAINAVGRQRLASDPAELEVLLGQTANPESLQYRPVTATGEFDPSREVLIRSQVELGQAGFHVITPLVFDDDSAVLVNRGWVPLTMDTPPVEVAPRRGPTELTGWAQVSQTRPPLGPEEPEGELDVLNRVDIERIAEQVPYELAPVYLVAMGEGSDDLPIETDPPDFNDEGPHLAYAIQWFGFAAVGLVGMFFLLRRQSGPTEPGGSGPGLARPSTTS